MSIRMLPFAAAFAIVASAASAQTPPPPPTNPTVPPTPNAVTPPGGVARGVIKPDQPVDSGMITQPPAAGTQTMPVIRPPATSR